MKNNCILGLVSYCCCVSQRTLSPSSQPSPPVVHSSPLCPSSLARVTVLSNPKALYQLSLINLYNTPMR